jgi:hypothetical protein
MRTVLILITLNSQILHIFSTNITARGGFSRNAENVHIELSIAAEFSPPQRLSASQPPLGKPAIFYSLDWQGYAAA